ncbi:MAG: hypothetical protein WD397_04730 [Wenzhouxiangellaceae bacterium]
MSNLFSEILTAPMFLLATVALVLLALVFVLTPLMRPNASTAKLARRRRALAELRYDLDPADYRRRMAKLDQEQAQAGGQPRSMRGLSALLIISVPLLALFLYTQVGTPDGITPEAGQSTELRAMLGDLTNRVRKQPEDVDSWNRLGMIWKQMQQYPAAEAAFRRVLFIEPENTFARVELAETLLYASGRAQIPEAADELLDSVLVDDPNNQKALWLAGLGAFHDGNSRRALALWTRLRDQLPAGSVRDQVNDQIARIPGGTEADETSAATRPAPVNPHAGLSPAGNGEDSSTPRGDAPADGAAIEVKVSLDPALAGRVSGAETVFVFARAVNGPPAPLAVKRLAASDLPASVTLDDGDAMAEGMSLSTFPEVQISARISRTGNAIAASGDIQGQSGPLTVGQDQQIELVMDEVID